jgi:hypothetical protein
LQYIKVITKEFQLDRSPPKRPVLTVDDLLELLHYNMVLDTAVFPDEEQRLLLNLLLLFAAYTGARPVSLVDASVKNLDESTSDVVRDPAIRFYDSSEEDEDDNTGAKQSGSSEDVPKSEQLKSVLFEHVTIMAVRAQGRMRLAMWVTLIHTKGEDRKPQPFVQTRLPYSRANASSERHFECSRTRTLCFAPLLTWWLLASITRRSLPLPFAIQKTYTAHAFLIERIA